MSKTPGQSIKGLDDMSVNGVNARLVAGFYSRLQICMLDFKKSLGVKSRVIGSLRIIM